MLNAAVQRFANALSNENDAIERVRILLQQVQAINPYFTLPAPHMTPIFIRPSIWYILTVLQPGIYWDTVIFQFDNLTVENITNLFSYMGFAPQATQLTLTLQQYTSLMPLHGPHTRLNFFSSAPNDLFSVEREQERIREEKEHIRWFETRHRHRADPDDPSDP